MWAMRHLAEPGDILFYRYDGDEPIYDGLIVGIEKLFGLGPRAMSYYHVSMVMSNLSEQVEAKWPRVRISAIDWEHEDLELWRVGSASYEQRTTAITNAIMHAGDLYDIGGFFFGWFRNTHRRICTTLVTEAYSASGVILLSPGKKLVTPNELADSPELEKVA